MKELNEYKTTVVDGKEYFLVPKPAQDKLLDKDGKEITIEMYKVDTKNYVYVKTKGWWKKDGVLEWAKYYREESMSDGSFIWYRTYGGCVTADKTESLFLESWYQNWLNLSKVERLDNFLNTKENGL